MTKWYTQKWYIYCYLFLPFNGKSCKVLSEKPIHLMHSTSYAGFMHFSISFNPFIIIMNVRGSWRTILRKETTTQYKGGISAFIESDVVPCYSCTESTIVIFATDIR